MIVDGRRQQDEDRKSTRLNSSHLGISYAVFCLKKKKGTVVGRASRPGDQQKRGTGCFTSRGGLSTPPQPVTIIARCRPPVCLTFYFFFLINGPPPEFPFFPHPALLQF